MNPYEQAVQKGENNTIMPWPLLRNHHYKITATGTPEHPTTRSGGGMSIQSEILYSKSINFDKPKEEKKEKEGKVTENKKIEKE